MLFSMRTILSLLKDRESDESFALMVACYHGATCDDYVKRRYLNERPTDAKSMCTMLQGRLGKRPALFPSGHHTGSKRQAVSPPISDEKVPTFSGKCHICRRSGHRAVNCTNSATVPQRAKSGDFKVTCLKCGMPGHTSPNCPTVNRKTEERKVNICEQEILPMGHLKLRSGETFPFSFDTGPDCSLLKQNIACKFDGERFNTLTTLKGIGGSCSACSHLTSTVVEIQGIFLELLFFVVPVNFMSASIILGKDIMKQNVAVRFSSDGLSFSRELKVQICEKEYVNFDKIDTDITKSDRQNLINLLANFREHFV
ncbi:unnamed protein product [Phaedon cochleariae]|uniref:CCHC-type domain-containing protein n=1 Tax=Phaedon cochleariae TaxID=80249 RepID=A0A9N9X443_PHACE|nr:unnamed protein product [Phaedon cochleariae]